ncbi:LysR family transcriptional regulator [Rhizobium sp. NLR9b]|uniref:LysR family transcriptional regulator n=1 Tax=unclassified Rhizobium TaxID=2613769 RepID=UPI001C837258|nr:MULTISPECIES: LysR family transcriptional regulator [unclassified Rhizobium]MBX5230687.1 LysR family transcriptional regulator [Rhizobium sp. NLR9b]MBX5291355.1 LysR family transcriptional regulator [Rhizobium sp. NLR10b]
MNLASIDLNLLVALEALLEHRNVTYAGQHVGRSQPAMSRALARLRDIFNDEILVRGSAGYVITPRGQRLAELLPAALNNIKTMVIESNLPATKWGPQTVVAMPDHQTLVLLPRLLQRAPHLEIIPHSLCDDVLGGLEKGDIDLAVGQIVTAPTGYLRRILYTDQLMYLLRHDHPALAQEWTIENLMALRHTATRSDCLMQGGQIYDELPDLELPDKHPRRFSHVLTAAMVAAATDCALLVPRRAAIQISAMLPLTAVAPPAESKPYEVTLIWHERCHRDPKHKWLRTEFAEAAAAGATG